MNKGNKGHRRRSKLKKTLSWKDQKAGVQGNGDYDGCFKPGPYWDKGSFLDTIKTKVLLMLCNRQY